MERVVYLPMIMYILACIFIVIGAFLIDKTIGFIVLGGACLATSFKLSNELEQVDDINNKGASE